MIFICFTIVDFPDSPEPEEKGRHEYVKFEGHCQIDAPNSNSLHSLVNFLLSSVICLSAVWILSLCVLP